MLYAIMQKGKQGYWLGKDYWNKGYATEAVKAVIGYGFEKLRLNRIYAGHFTKNPASGRVMQKTGMTHEGLGREHILHWGVYEDMVECAILRKGTKRIIGTDK